MVMVTYYNIYYCVIVAWSLYYFIASFVAIPDLPWNTCGELYFRTYVVHIYLEHRHGMKQFPIIRRRSLIFEMPYKV